MKIIKKYIKNLIYRIRGEVTTSELVKRGMRVGTNFSRQNNVFLDPGHCWLIEIGDNVTLAPRVVFLCHDASTKRYTGYAKIGKIVVGDNVFVGANTVILPGVRIGSNVVIGANSTICKDIPSGCVVAGTPSRILYSLDEYVERVNDMKKNIPAYDESYTMRGGITQDKKDEMSRVLDTERIVLVE